MAGLDLTDEQRKAEIAALVRELNSYEARVRGGDESYKPRVELVREALRQRGHGAVAPPRRASRRDSSVVTKETR